MEEDKQTQVSTQEKPETEKFSSKTLIIVVVLVVLGVVGYLLYSRQGGYQLSSPTTQRVPEAPGADVEEMVVEEEREVREITVEGDEFSFSPQTISLIAGEKVRLTFRNTGNTSHNLTIEGTDIATKTVSSRGSDVIEFTAPETGTYTFYCSVGNHRALGMEGELEAQ